MNSAEQFTDQEIIEKILHGQLPLFEILIRRNNPYLYKVGRSYNFNHEDTQDLMQDTFIAAYCNLSKFENRSSFKTWIVKIMLNNCFRKQQKFSFKNETAKDINELSTPLFAQPKHTDTYQKLMNKELNTVIEKALQRIALDYRMVFSLREMNNLNVKETAEVLNISEGNVKIRLNRAKAMLRKEVERFYSTAEIFDFNLIYCDTMVNKVMGKLKEMNK